MEGQEQYPKQALDKFRQWHFWWLVVFSAFLIITFVYYLPARFLNQVVQEETERGHETGSGQITEEYMREHMEEGMTDEEMKKHMDQEHSGEMMPASPVGGHEEESMMSSEMMDEHDEDGHSATDYFEESDVREGLAVNLNVKPVPYLMGVPLTMEFFVSQKPSNISIFADQLQIEHEKLMHVIGIRTDMNEFFHIHPEALLDNNSIFTTSFVFQKPGLYKVWSEIKKDGVNYTFGHPEILVIGSGNASDKPFDKTQGKQVSFERNVVAGDYQVSLNMDEPVVKGREADLSFDIHTLTGMEIDTEDYLGAKMHLSVIKDDLKQFIHTHPNEGDHQHGINFIQSAKAHGEIGGDETIDFNVIFTEPGLYKAFAQFRPAGIGLPIDQALLVVFWIEVQESAKLPISSWTLLLLISAALIVLLSWGVSKYINVRGAQ